MMCVCPACHATVSTSTVYKPGAMCILLCVVLCLFGLVLGCCLIPFCIDSVKDVIHKCPNCGAVIARYNRL